MINPNASKWMKNTKNGKHWAMTGYEVFVCAASVFSGCFLLFSLPFLLFFSFTLVAASSPIPSLFPSFSFSGCSLLFSLPFPLFFTLVAAPSSPLFSFQWLLPPFPLQLLLPPFSSDDYDYEVVRRVPLVAASSLFIFPPFPSEQSFHRRNTKKGKGSCCLLTWALKNGWFYDFC